MSDDAHDDEPKRRAGRPRGSKNVRTLEREAQERAVQAEMAATLTPEAILAMSALEVMRFAMQAYMRSGQFSTASEIAARLAAAEDRRSPSVAPGAPEDRRAALISSIGNDTPPARQDRGKRADGSMAPSAFN